MTKTIAVTGARGYIGTNFCRLTKAKHKDVELIEIDVDSEEKYYDADVLVHMAAPSSVDEWEYDSQEAMTKLATCNAWLYRIDAPKVVFTSTACMDGMYAWSKRSTETLLDVRWGEEATVLRLHNVVSGTYSRLREHTHLFPKLMSRKLTIHGDGSQARDYVHVYDVCEAIWIACGLPSDRTVAPCYAGKKIQEVGTGCARSVLEILVAWGRFSRDHEVLLSFGPQRMTHVQYQEAYREYFNEGMLNLSTMIRDCGYHD